MKSPGMPIQSAGGPSGLILPEALGRKVYDAYVKKFGKQQSYERIVERGGFGLFECILILYGVGPKDGDVFQRKLVQFLREAWPAEAVPARAPEEGKSSANAEEISALSKILFDEEGSKPYVYKDSEGFWTIGIGRLVDERKGGGLSREEQEYLLSNDMAAARSEMEKEPYWHQLNTARRVVVMAMAFQMGAAGYRKFSNLRGALSRKDYLAAGSHMLDSLWAEQTPKRARRMAAIMVSGVLPA